LAVLVIGAMLAHWTWVLFAPRSASVLPAAQAVADLQSEHLFGIAAVKAGAAQVALPNVRLVGVFAGAPGFAIMELDGKRQLGLATGREIVAGTRLVEVAADHAVIERDGVRQQIQLERKTLPVKPVATTALQAVSSVLPTQSASSVPDVSVRGELLHERGGL